MFVAYWFDLFVNTITNLRYICKHICKNASNIIPFLIILHFNSIWSDEVGFGYAETGKWCIFA